MAHGDRGGARKRRKRQPAIVPSPVQGSISGGGGELRPPEPVPVRRAPVRAPAPAPISDTGMQTRQPRRAAAHQKPVQESPQSYARRELVNPKPNFAEDLRVLGFEGASELLRARARLRAYIRTLHEPRLQAQTPAQEAQTRLLEATPPTKERQTELALQGSGAMGLIDKAYGPEGRPEHVLKNYVVGKSLYNLIHEGHTSAPWSAALEAGMFVTGPLRILGAVGKGGKAALAGKTAAEALEAARAGHAAPGIIPGAARLTGKGLSNAASKMKLRTFEVGGHVVQIPAARARTGRVIERLADRYRDKLPVLKSTAAKGGRELGYSVEHVQAGTKNTYADALKHAARFLTAPQEYALRIVAEGETPASRIAFHDAQASVAHRTDQVYYHALHKDMVERAAKYIKLVNDPVKGVVPELADNAPAKLKRSWELFQKAGAMREDLIHDLGLISDQTIARRIHTPGRVMRGARWKSFDEQMQAALAASPSRKAVFDAIDKVASSPQAAKHDKALWDAAVRSAATRLGVPPEQLAPAVESFWSHLAGVRTDVTTEGLPPKMQALFQTAAKAQEPQTQQLYANLAKELRGHPGVPFTAKSAPRINALLLGLRERAIEAEAYRFWYTESAKAILDHVGGDVDKATKLAQLLAIYSPRAKVWDETSWNNVTRAIGAFDEFNKTGKVSPTWSLSKEGAAYRQRAELAAQRGEEIKPHRDWQTEEANKVMRGEGNWTGLKTNNFYRNFLEDINPAKYAEEFGSEKGVTVDTWIRRAFHYPRTGTKGNETITPEMYEFMSRAVTGIAHELGWAPKEAQAAIWTSIKSEMEGTPLDKAGVSFKEALSAMRSRGDQHVLFQEELPKGPHPDREAHLMESVAKAAPDIPQEERDNLVNAFMQYRQSGDEVPFEQALTGIIDRLGGYTPAPLRDLLDELRLPQSVKDEYPTPEYLNKVVTGIRPEAIDRMYSENRGRDLLGLPGSVKFRGKEISPHSNADAQRIAYEYVFSAKGTYAPPRIYVDVDESTARRIADLYEKMKHDPENPAVKASYKAMADETLEQYNEIVKQGYTFEFYPTDRDPYPHGPREAMVDLMRNKHMYVYPTEAGFGTEGAAHADHPLLAHSGVVWGEQPATHNDIFRAVHDFFGHFKEGVGFRADGEENAWLQHKSMYSPLAAKAMTSETRGQNSWVNWGPHGEANRTAGQAETVYADQKAGLLPDWVVNDETGIPREAEQPLDIRRDLEAAAGKGDHPWEGLDPEFQQKARDLLNEHGAEPLEPVNDFSGTLPENTYPPAFPGIPHLSSRRESREMFVQMNGVISDAEAAGLPEQVTSRLAMEAGIEQAVREGDYETAQVLANAITKGIKGFEKRAGIPEPTPSAEWLREHPEVADKPQYLPEAGAEFYQRGGALEKVSAYGIKGAIQIDPAAKVAILHLTEASDDTTLAHELAHFTRAFLTDNVKWKPVLKYLGVKNGVWTREAEEKFARSLEQVIRTGNGPAQVKDAFRGLAPIFREVYSQSDLPDVPPHVSRFIQRLFEYDQPKGGSLVGYEDLTNGVEYAPAVRGVPTRLSRPGRAFSAYMRRAGSGTHKLFSGGRAGRAIGGGPSDQALKHEMTGSLLQSGFWTFDVTEPKIASSLLATKMSLAHIARKALVDAGEELPQDASWFAVKVDPKKDASKELKATWDKINSLQAGSSDETLLENTTIQLLNDALHSVVPDNTTRAKLYQEVMRTGRPVDNIVWVHPDFLEHSGLLQVPSASAAQTDALRKIGNVALFGYDALNDAQKALVLYLNPAYVPMQAIGNLGMNLLQQGAFMPLNMWRSVIFHRELDPMYRVFIDSKMGTGAATALPMVTSGAKALQATLGHWSNVAADLLPRRLSFIHEARKLGIHPREFPEMIDKALAGDAEANQLIEYITRRAKRSIVDFERMNEFEKKYVTRAIWFYPWLRGATDYSIHFIADHPIQSMAMALAAEHLRVTQDEKLKDQPYYAQLDVPISTASLGLKVPGTGLDVGLDQAVGDKTLNGPGGTPAVFSLRQLLTQTTPLELLQTGIGFATGNNPEAGGDLVQHLTPIPYAAGVATFGYDPFRRQEVPSSLATFFGQMTPVDSPIWQRWNALNQSPEERKKANEKQLHPRSEWMDWARLFGGSMAPSGYNQGRAEELSLKHKPMLARRIAQLKIDAHDAGVPAPNDRVLEDLTWKTKLDQAISDLGSDAPYSAIVKETARLYDERFHRNLSARAARLRTEGQAQRLYYSIRPRLYPAYSRYQLRIDHIHDRRIAREPVAQG